MKESDSSGGYVLAFASGFILMLVIAMTISTPKRVWRQEAIEHNAAEYVCDPATGATEFRWKEQTK